MTRILEYKCPSCAAAFTFDPTIQKMKCAHCEAEIEVECLSDQDDLLKELPASEDLIWGERGHRQQLESEEERVQLYICQSCAGELLTDETTIATSCPYCDNSVVLTERIRGDLKPDYLIPFKLDMEAAKQAFSQHLSGKRFLPKVFTKNNHIDDIKGVYVPFWLFNVTAEVDGRFSGIKSEHWVIGNDSYTKVSHYSLLRSAEMVYQQVPVDASQRITDDVMQSLEPFDFFEAEEFQTAYLAGYLADRYDQPADTSLAVANQRIRQTTEKRLISSIQGFDSVSVDEMSVRLKNDGALYALYPVWFLTTSWKGRSYLFAMNGQTGKFVGDLPFDRWAYWRYFLLLALGFSLVLSALAWAIL